MSHTSSSNIDIATLRKLLERWYEGVTSPEEEELLIREFSSRDTSALPADLAEERMIFTAISAPPIDEKEAEAAISKAIGNVRSRKNMFCLHLSRLAAAACAAIALAIGVAIMQYSHEPQRDGALIASIAVPDIGSGRPAPLAHTGTSTGTPDPAIAGSRKITKKAAASASARADAKQASAPADYGYREPTEEEAEAILLTLNNEHQRIIDATENTCERVNSSLYAVKAEMEDASEYMEYEEYFELLNFDGHEIH